MGWVLLGAFMGAGIFLAKRRATRRDTSLSVAEGRRRWEAGGF